MKKIKKPLSLNRETIRALGGAQLVDAVGGVSGNACSVGHTGCNLCNTPHPSLAFSNCNACVTDICTFDGCTVVSVFG